MKQRAWIAIVEPADAQVELARAYAEVGARDGDLSNILAVQSLDPRALSAHYQLYRSLMHTTSPLTPTQRESIAVVVSLANDCHYRIAHRSAALRAASRDEAYPDWLRSAAGRATLSALDQAILAYAEKLTRRSASIEHSDIEALRELGLSDDAILRVAEITSYFNFVNRLADGLGVALEAERVEGGAP